MTLLSWFSLSVSVPGQGKTLNDGMDAVLAFKDKNLLDWPIVTDVQMVLSPLDATLFAAFALFAALFFPPAALLVAAHDRGSAQPGLSPVVSLPLPPGNSHCRGCCHGCFQSPGLMLAATCCDFLLRVLLMAAMILAVFEGVCESTLLLAVFELVLPCLAGTGSPCEGVENARVLAVRADGLGILCECQE